MTLRALLSAAFVIGTMTLASATIGSGAVRGDNCTPFNSYKIGYALPKGTIISQSVVIANGWLAGWILETSAAKRYYIPNPQFFDHDLRESEVVLGVPPSVALGTLNSALLDRAYRQMRQAEKRSSQHVDRDSPPQLPATTVVAPCFARPLRV
jgi:hypothetical protein